MVVVMAVVMAVVMGDVMVNVYERIRPEIAHRRRVEFRPEFNDFVLAWNPDLFGAVTSMFSAPLLLRTGGPGSEANLQGTNLSAS